MWNLRDHLRSADPISQPTGALLRGYPARLAQTPREPKPWRGGFPCNPLHQLPIPASNLQENLKFPPTASAGAKIAITHDFNNTRIRRDSCCIHTVLMRMNYVN